MDFTSRQLRAFLLVAQNRSFSRAAEALFLTPSGVSVLIRELETQLGFRLFDRTTRSVTLTSYGRALAPLIRRTIDELDDATSAIGQAAGDASRAVSVGAPPLIATNVLPQAIREFRVHHPGVRIRIFDADLTTIVHKVADGTLDMGIGIFTTAPDLRRVRLFRFSFILIRSRDAATPRTSVTWSAAGAGTLVVLPSQSPVQQVIDRHLARAGVRRVDSIEVNALDTQIALAESGEGAAIIPSFGLPVCRDRNVAMSRLINPVVTMDFHQIRSRGKKLPQVADAFTLFLQGYVSRWAGRAGVF